MCMLNEGPTTRLKEDTRVYKLYLVGSERVLTNYHSGHLWITKPGKQISRKPFEERFGFQGFTSLEAALDYMPESALVLRSVIVPKGTLIAYGRDDDEGKCRFHSYYIGKSDLGVRFWEEEILRKERCLPGSNWLATEARKRISSQTCAIDEKGEKKC